jgi:thiamine-monophosphate kinase
MMRDEAALVAKLRSLFPEYHQPLGIGDDAAILNGHVITTDMLIEDVDFTSDIPIAFIAAKSLAVNLSDLAAMGATPRAFLLSVGLPAWALEQFDVFATSLAEVAAAFNIALIGGDLSAAAKLTISLTAIGSAPERPLLRSGARPGDRIFISRPLGGSATGLHLLGSGWRISPSGIATAPEEIDYVEKEIASSAIMRHVAPDPEVALGIRLAGIPEVTSCIDVSDGFSTDLARLCEASSCGALVDLDRLPPFPDLPSLARRIRFPVEPAVLHGGEEYSLLFTSTLRESEMSIRCGRPVFSVGRIREGSGVFLERERAEEPLLPRGFDHFSR